MKVYKRNFKFYPYLVLILALAVGLLMINPMQEQFSALASQFKASIEQILLTELGLHLEYESISPGILKDLEMRKLRLKRSDGTIIASVERVRVSYDLFDLMAGKTLEALRDIELINYTLSIDEQKDRDLLAKVLTTPKDQQILLETVMESLTSSLKPGAKLVLIEGQVDYFAQNGSRFGISPRLIQFIRDREALRLVCPEIKANVESAGRRQIELALGLEGNYTTSSKIFFGNVRLNSFVGPDYEIIPQEFSFSWHSDALHLQRVADARPLDLSLVYSVADQTLDAVVESRSLPLSAIIRFSGEIGQGLKVLGDPPIDVSASLHYEIPSAVMAYQLRLETRTEIKELGPTNLLLAIEGDQDYLDLNDLSLDGTWGGFKAQGLVNLKNLSLNAQLNGQYSIAGLKAPLVVAGTLAGGLKQLTFNASLVKIDTFKLDTLRADLFPETADFRILAQTSDSNSHRLELTSQGNFAQQLSLTASLTANNYAVFDPLSPVELLPELKNLLPGIFADDLNLSTDMTFKLVAKKPEITITNLTLSSQSLAKEFLSLQGSFNFQKLDLAVQNLDIAGFKGQFALAAIIEAGWWNGGVKGTLNSFPLEFNGRLSQALNYLELSGNHGLYVSVQERQNLFQGEYRLEGFPLDLATYKGQLSSSGAFSWDPLTSDWRLGIDSISLLVKGIIPGYKEGYSRLNASAEINSQAITIHSLQYIDPIGSVSGQGMVGGISGSNPWLNINLKGSGLNAETLDLNASIKQGELSGLINAQNFRIARLGIQGLEGGLELKGQLSGTIEDPNLNLSFGLRQGRINNVVILAEGQASINKGQIIVTTMQAEVLKHRLLAENLLFKPMEQVVQGRLSYIYSDYEGQMDLDFDIRMDPDDQGLSTFNIIGIPFTWQKRGDLFLTGVRTARGWEWNEKNQTVSALIRPDGRFQASARQPMPFRGNVEGQIRNAELDLVLSDLVIPVEPLAGALDLGFLGFDKGTLTGNLRVAGPLVDPSFYGSLHVNKMQAHIVMNPHPLLAESAELVFDDRELSILPSVVMAGKTQVNLSGTLVLSRYDIASYAIDVACIDPAGIEVDYAFGILGIKGRATGNVRVYGTQAFVQIDGELQSFNTLLSTVTAAPEPPPGKTDVGVRLKIQSGPRVEFIYPNTNTPILRSYIERNQVISLAFNTINRNLEVNGDVNLRGGEILYLGRNFYVKDAVMTLNEKNQVFNPIINGKAELKMPINGETYKIMLTFENNRLMNLQPRISSSPSLSALEISNVLAGTQLSQEKQNTLIIYTGGEYATRWLLSEIGISLDFLHTIESSVRNLLGVDVLSVRTEILPALVREAVAPLDNDSVSFGKYLDNTAIMVGKYLGDDLYIQLMGQLKAQDALTENPTPLGVDVELELSMEFSTPFFDLEWSFIPKNSDELFLRDNRFTFSWSLY